MSSRSASTGVSTPSTPSARCSASPAALRRRPMPSFIPELGSTLHLVGVCVNRIGKGRPFKIEFVDMAEGGKPAFVKFRPLVLHVDRETWELAGQGEEKSRHILAHEIGHLLLHDHFAKAF